MEEGHLNTVTSSLCISWNKNRLEKSGNQTQDLLIRRQRRDHESDGWTSWLTLYNSLQDPDVSWSAPCILVSCDSLGPTLYLLGSSEESHRTGNSSKSTTRDATNASWRHKPIKFSEKSLTNLCDLRERETGRFAKLWIESLLRIRHAYQYVFLSSTLQC